MGGEDENGNVIVKARIVNDMKAINDNTYPYIYENLQISDLLDSLTGCILFNTTDIKNWFYHIPVLESKQRFLSVRAPQGALLASRAPQGAKNLPIYAFEIATKIFEGVAQTTQDDVNQGIRAQSMESAKIKAFERFIDIIDVAL